MPVAEPRPTDAVWSLTRPAIDFRRGPSRAPPPRFDQDVPDGKKGSPCQAALIQSPISKTNAAPRSAAKFNAAFSPRLPAKLSVVETSLAEAETIKP